MSSNGYDMPYVIVRLRLLTKNIKYYNYNYNIILI